VEQLEHHVCRFEDQHLTRFTAHAVHVLSAPSSAPSLMGPGLPGPWIIASACFLLKRPQYRAPVSQVPELATLQSVSSRTLIKFPGFEAPSDVAV
jgi:hypothetical protein